MIDITNIKTSFAGTADEFWIIGENCFTLQFCGSKEKAIEYAKTLINCRSCKNCVNCENCSFCDTCTNCKSCSFCNMCDNCDDCYSCANCKYCAECKKLANTSYQQKVIAEYKHLQ